MQAIVPVLLKQFHGGPVVAPVAIGVFATPAGGVYPAGQLRGEIYLAGVIAGRCYPAGVQVSEVHL